MQIYFFRQQVCCPWPLPVRQPTGGPEHHRFPERRLRVPNTPNYCSDCVVSVGLFDKTLTPFRGGEGCFSLPITNGLHPLDSRVFFFPSPPVFNNRAAHPTFGSKKTDTNSKRKAVACDRKLIFRVDIHDMLFEKNTYKSDEWNNHKQTYDIVNWSHTYTFLHAASCSHFISYPPLGWPSQEAMFGGNLRMVLLETPVHPIFQTKYGVIYIIHLIPANEFRGYVMAADYKSQEKYFEMKLAMFFCVVGAQTAHSKMLQFNCLNGIWISLCPRYAFLMCNVGISYIMKGITTNTCWFHFNKDNES